MCFVVCVMCLPCLCDFRLPFRVGPVSSQSECSVQYSVVLSSLLLSKFFKTPHHARRGRHHVRVCSARARRVVPCAVCVPDRSRRPRPARASEVVRKPVHGETSGSSAASLATPSPLCCPQSALSWEIAALQCSPASATSAGDHPRCCHQTHRRGRCPLTLIRRC